MKRTVGALLMLGGLGGCMSPGNVNVAETANFNRVSYGREVPGYVGTGGEPVHASRAYGGAGERRGLITDWLGMDAGADPAQPKARAAAPAAPGTPEKAGETAKTAPKTAKVDPAVKPAGGKASFSTNDAGIQQVNGTLVGPAGLPGPGAIPSGMFPPNPGNPYGQGGRQALGPPGAVAAVGAIVGGPGPGSYTGLRSEVRFSNPPGMKVQWFGPPEAGGNGRNQLETPGRYNFLQGGVYRLKLSDIALRPGLELYPTLEVFPCTQKTGTFLSHAAIPIAFTDEDFEQVVNGNLVVKVIYLPDPQFQDLAVAGPDEVVSTRLEPGVDPILEATRRGTILAIVRIGNIDLEAPGTPPLDAPPPGGPGGLPGGPEGLPIGKLPTGPGMIPAPGLVGKPPVPAVPTSLPSPSAPPTAGRASISTPAESAPSAPALLPPQ